MAMLTVTLVATFAAAAMWQQWRAVEVERAERARVQAGWILTGALDWARLILREDARSGGADHLNEPWAVPLQEARLSTFLAAGTDGAAAVADGGDELDAFLSGEIIDLQSKLNLTNLIDGGRVHPASRIAFERLFDLLGLPAGELSRLIENLRFARDPSADNRSGAFAPLAPQRLAQITWLGVSPETAAALEPYVTLLPMNTPVNINTASEQVLAASSPGLSLADAQRLVAERANQHFRSLADAQRVLGGGGGFDDGQHSVASRYFEVRGRLRLDHLTVEERSVVQRDGLQVRVLDRVRGAAVAGTGR